MSVSINTPEWNHAIRQLADLCIPFRLPKRFDKVAVIIEPRCIDILTDLLKWMVWLLSPKGWMFIVYVGNNNSDIVTNFIEIYNLADIVFVRSLGCDNLTIENYNLLLTSRSFWESMPYENVLVFQSDTVILQGNLKAFLDYDYVGAPWNKNFKWLRSPDRHVTGNGGLSLRRKSGMLKAISAFPYTGHNEDGYFCLKCKSVLNIAPPEIAMKFSVETVPYEFPVGIHKCWRYMSREYMVKLYNYIKSIDTCIFKKVLYLIPIKADKFKKVLYLIPIQSFSYTHVDNT